GEEGDGRVGAEPGDEAEQPRPDGWRQRQQQGGDPVHGGSFAFGEVQNALCMAAVDPPETDPVGQLLRRRPPAAALGWAAAAFGPGSRVVAVRPRGSAWLANHAVDVADAAGAVHRVVGRRWARPGWAEEDPDFNA